VLTIIFAFLATAYLVGRRLTWPQAVLISVLFMVGATASLFMTLVEFARATMFMDRLESQFGEQSISPNVVVIPVFGIVMGLLIVASVYNMIHVRHDRRR
jgi:uncharacterized protein YacL